jgi:hypothetical protein
MVKNECECLCHVMAKGACVHRTEPCCEGKCPVCGKFIKKGRMVSHIAECHSDVSAAN